MSLITVKSLTEDQKDSIVMVYLEKTSTMKYIAKIFNTSTRTIGRVLAERGYLTPTTQLKADAARVMKLLDYRGIDYTTLLTILDKSATPASTPAPAPTINANTVQAYLNKCSKEQLAIHFYTSGLVKLAEIAKNINDKKNNRPDNITVSANDATHDQQAETLLTGV